MENYAAVKARLLRQTAKDGQVAVGVDDEYSAAIFTQIAAAGGGAGAIPCRWAKCWAAASSWWMARSTMRRAGAPSRSWTWRQPSHLPGAHNWQNAALAYAAVQAFCHRHQGGRHRHRGFPGPRPSHGRCRPYRQDASSSTIPRPPMPTPRRGRSPSIPTFSGSPGGKPKDGGIDCLASYFPRIRKAYLIGEAAGQFARTLDGKALYEMSGTLDSRGEQRRCRCRALPPPKRLWCCCRRPARLTTSSRISSSAAMSFATLVARLPQDCARAAS